MSAADILLGLATLISGYLDLLDLLSLVWNNYKA